MALTKLASIPEIATAVAPHGLLTYFGTNSGKVYQGVNSTGVITLLCNLNERVVALSIDHPTLYISTDAGNVYKYDISIAADPYVGIEMAGTYANHMIYLHPTSLATGKRCIRIADYGAEIALASGDGIIRTYAKVISGTTDTALQFHWGFTTCAAGLIGSQIQIESWADTPGPSDIRANDFFAAIADGKYLAGGVGFTSGLCATWHKVFASVGSVCNGNVAAIWLDNQMSCAVGGIEASIKSSTGGTVPDCWAWFNTTSAGWASLFYFDGTMASKAPLSTKKPTSQTYPGDKSLIVNIDGTLYYLPLYEVGHCT